MAGNQDEDMYLFQGGLDQTPNAFVGNDFDAFLASPNTTGDAMNYSGGFLNPNDLTIKKEEGMSPAIRNHTLARSTRSSGSSSSSSGSGRNHKRNVSDISAMSSTAQQRNQGAWNGGINGYVMPTGDNYFDDASMTGLDTDFDAVNEQMASDFDFDTAASTPSGFDAFASSTAKPSMTAQPFRQTANFTSYGQGRNASPRLPTTGQPQFFFAGSREASPLNAMLPSAQAQSPWNKHSPSSGLEETFGGITMNGDSPGHATFSPGMAFGSTGFTFDPESSNTPSTFAKDISSPPSTIHSSSADGIHTLTVYPTSLKSRVETQIPIKMTLAPLPNGVKKLRLPTHTVSKPKFLAKADVENSADTLELYVSLVCTSAMQDPVRLDRAFARARGEEPTPYVKPSPDSSNGSQTSKDDEEKPLNGGEVRICSGCIQRERKRASRKKQKKPEEEELFQKDEEKRVVVFNTNEVKEWVEASKEPPAGIPGNADFYVKPPPPGAMQVELPMRIACYCRHQNEKMGFQVIFTIKDWKDKVIAQAMTNPIMITDDHKTHNAPAQMSSTGAPLPNAPQLPGAGVFSTAGNEAPMPAVPPPNPKLFKQSFSTTDLHNLQHNFNPNFPMAPMSNPFAIPSGVSHQTSATMTPRNLSRPGSPTGIGGPTKRRKQSGSGKLPSGLTMTRLDTGLQGPATMPNTAASSPYAGHLQPNMPSTDRYFQMQPSRPPQFGSSPPTPNGGIDPNLIAGINRSFSLENLPRQAVISAPPSRQPSRPGSPVSGRNSMSGNDGNFGQAVANQLMGNQTARRPPPLIHKLVPAEGSVTGGTEVTLLGNGFYQGLEVMFGDTEATTTTYWGEKCLNCIAPPALQPGTVAVVFKHEHHQYTPGPPHSQHRPSVFTYIDDRELEIFRLALRSIGKQMQHPTDDPYSTAQQLIQGQQQGGMWPQGGNYGMGGGRQHRAGGSNGNAPMDTIELDIVMMNLLDFVDRQNNSKPVNLNCKRPSGMTLLHLASSLGLIRFVAGLLVRGVRVDIADKNGHTAMHHAAMQGHVQIIRRLRLAGANHLARSLRNFTPADMATSLLVYQASAVSGQARSRSAGTPHHAHSRNASSTSLRAFWDDSFNNNFESTSDDDSDYDDDSSSASSPARSHSRETLESQEVGKVAASRSVSRQGSGNVAVVSDTFTEEDAVSAEPAVSEAGLLAWHRSLVNQIQNFNESTQWMRPNLNLPAIPTLPALPAFPDYQTNAMVRRVSSLLPQRPNMRQLAPGSTTREGWWETLTGTSAPATTAPPSYNELYPEDGPSAQDWELKKISAVQAAADTAADMHFAANDTPSVREGSSVQAVSKPGNQVVTRPIQRVELRRDRKLFFFWIPIMAIVLGLMLHNSGLLQTLSNTRDFVFQKLGREEVQVL